MAETEAIERGWWSGQRRVFVILFVGVCAALVLAYWLFLRTDYAVLYSGMKPADAAAVVAQLDAKGISHRLRDDGTTILVPTDQTDNVRLSVAGSDILMKGSVGFELFNKSDMGLTDFAQKVNYQRALQGELARTIMMMDGIDTARVHLAIPERSLFRGEHSNPKAAVEVVAKLGRPLTSDRVAGIQQLVASAVPDLPLGQVVVLDGDGRIISQVAAVETAQTPEIAEQAAAQSYYNARAKAALASAMPGVQADVRTLLLPTAHEAAALGAPAAAAGTGGSRDFQLRVTVLTEAALRDDDAAVARKAVAAAVGLDEQRGDSLAFEVGPVVTPSSVPMPAALASPVLAGPPDAKTMPDADPERSYLPGATIVLALLAAFAIVILLLRPRGGTMSETDRAAFVARLRAQLSAVEKARA